MLISNFGPLLFAAAHFFSGSTRAVATQKENWKMNNLNVITFIEFILYYCMYDGYIYFFVPSAVLIPGLQTQAQYIQMNYKNGLLYVLRI